jgi:sulfite exporter TauE/SafE
MNDSWISLPEVGAALVMGVLGSPHCVGMCGGLATALAPAHGYSAHLGNGAGGSLLPLWLATGRIATYAALGALVGGAGGLLSSGFDGALVPLLRGALGLLLVSIGLSVAGWRPRSIAWLESLGAIVWRRLTPMGSRLLPADTAGRALAAGALWGLLPCGLVYAALAAAAVSGSATIGASWMASFGLGTVPAVAGAGWLARGMRARLSGLGARRSAGAILIASGIWTAAMPIWSHFAHGSHGPSVVEPHRAHHEADAAPYHGS